MSKRSDNGARLELRTLIAETHASFCDPRSATPPAVIDRFMDRRWKSLWGQNERVVKEGFMEGLARLVRNEMHTARVLLGLGPDEVDEESGQLDLGLWPEDERDISRQIGA